MINDGFFKYEPNVTLEFGNDNKIYVVAISPIEAHNEFFFPYGAEYWMDPHRWSKLDRHIQQCVHRAYPEARVLPLEPEKSSFDIFRLPESS